MIDTLTEASKREAKAAEPVLRKRMIRLIGVSVAMVAAAAGGWYYLNSLAYESTDNAFIDGGVIQVSPKVSGQVLRVPVQDNQHVNKGDLIVEIDSRDYDARAAEARARLADISARAEGAQSNLQLTSTVTDAVLIQARAASDAAKDQIQIRQAHAEQDEFAVRAAEAALLQAESKCSLRTKLIDRAFSGLACGALPASVLDASDDEQRSDFTCTAARSSACASAIARWCAASRATPRRHSRPRSSSRNPAARAESAPARPLPQ